MAEAAYAKAQIKFPLLREKERESAMNNPPHNIQKIFLHLLWHRSYQKWQSYIRFRKVKTKTKVKVRLREKVKWKYGNGKVDVLF